MGVRLVAGVACVAVALVGLTLATPQEARFGFHVELDDLLDARGFNRAGIKPGDYDNKDLGKLLDRIDGLNLDPDLARNLDPEALAALLDGMTEAELAALGLTAAEAQALIDRLRDPDLTEADLADIAADLSDRGLGFVNDDADGRFDPGEAAYIDINGDGKVSSDDVKLGVLALLLGVDRGLSDGARQQLTAYELAGGLGLSRPPSAAARSTATGQTAPLTAQGYPSDRALGPGNVVCVQLYSPSLTCHARTFVHDTITRQGDHYRFLLSTTTPTALDPDAGAPGTRSSAQVQVLLQGTNWVAVPSLTPADTLVAFDRPDLELARDGNGMVWVRGGNGVHHLNLTWAVDLAYFDLPVAADITTTDVPAALRPRLDAAAMAVGNHIADAAGARDRTYGDAVRALAAHLRDFGLGALPDRDEQSDDLLAVAQAQVGCARHRAEAFTLAAQALGIPARLIVNEAHVFSEVFVPKAGWHLVDLGTCGRVQVHARPGHTEVMAHQDLPYEAADAPASQADAAATPRAPSIDILSWPASLRPNTDFDIGGVATADVTVPAGIPITFTYNRTKEQPGTPFCSTQTRQGGDFTATCRLPSGMPPAPNDGWQLVARLAPSVLAKAPSLPAYSDPPFVVQKATSLQLLGHAKTSADVPVAYTAHVVDEDGTAVPQRQVALSLDGDVTQTRATDSTGRARFTLQLATGPHTLTAQLLGDDSYDPSQDALQVEATATRILVNVDQARLDQGTLHVTGAVAVDDRASAGRSLSLRWRNDPNGAEQSKTLATGPNGVFQASFSGTPRPGPGLVTVIDSASGVGVDAAFARSVDAQATIQAPDRWALGTPVPVQVRLTGSVDPVPVRLTLNGENVADLEIGDGLPGNANVVVPLGVHTLAVEAGPGVRLSAAPVQVLSAALESFVDPVPIQSPGSTLRVEGHLRFDGHGLEGPLTLRLRGLQGNGSSASDGTFAIALTLPAVITPGNATAVLGIPGLGQQIEIPVRIQRPANLMVDAPRLSLNAFGTTTITVRGEGEVRVTADGDLLGFGGRLEVPSTTLLWKRITIDAQAVSSDPDVAPSRSTITMTVLNPATLAGGPLALLAIAWLTWLVAGAVHRRQAYRNRFWPPPPPSPIQVVSPELPPRVPRVFDASQDDLVLKLPRKGPWRVLDATGRPVAATLDGRLARIDLQRLPPGPQVLHFWRDRRHIAFPLNVQGLRTALDEATLAVLRRIGDAATWPAPLQAMQDGLHKAGASPAHAREVRQQAELSLYTADDIDRPRFHAFFQALDDAQAGRPT